MQLAGNAFEFQVSDRSYKFVDKDNGANFWELQLAEVLERPIREEKKKKDAEEALEKYRLDQLEAERIRKERAEQQNKSMFSYGKQKPSDNSTSNDTNSVAVADASTSCCLIS